MLAKELRRDGRRNYTHKNTSFRNHRSTRIPRRSLGIDLQGILIILHASQRIYDASGKLRIKSFDIWDRKAQRINPVSQIRVPIVYHRHKQPELHASHTEARDRDLDLRLLFPPVWFLLWTSGL